jgi:hypothetical protein
MSKGFILFLFTEAVPTVPYEILKMEKKSGTDENIQTLVKLQISSLAVV